MSTPKLARAARVAIVTGGGRGIGAATAQRLASDGHAVAVIDRDDAAAKEAANVIRAVGWSALAIGADITDPAQVTDAVSRVSEELGPPSVLVNNAGVTRDNLVYKMPHSDWDDVIAVHLRGAFLMTQAVQPHMVDARWGRIVNLSSTSALGNRGQANYSAAKAGLQGFTKTLAIELGKFGITVNCVAPGLIETDMTRATAQRVGEDWESFVSSRARMIPVGRAGKPDDVANAVAYFVSHDSDFVSGQVLYVAGGPKA